jgi:glycosyltransferase involved in cell wall biosynthesis
MQAYLYSVVIPVYNSERLVGETVRQTVDFFEKNRLRYEILLVNDGSPDNSWQVISELARTVPGVVAINLLKNYGQHTAVFCGIRQAKGDFLITMDDDLQNPPEEILKLIEKIHEGYDLVFARFEQKQHAGYRRLGTRLIGYLNKKVFFKPDHIVLTNFRIFSRDLAKRMGEYKTNFPYIPGLLLLHAHRMANTTTKHAPRPIGTSNYSLTRILTLMARLLFNYSSWPMKALTYVGLVIAGASFLMGIFFLIKGLLYGSAVEGWTTLVVMLAFFNGFVILMLGVMGEYLARLMNQVAVEEPYHLLERIEKEG